MSRLMKTLMMALVAGVIGVSAPSPGFAAGGESDDSTPSAVRQARDLLDKKHYAAAVPILTASLATAPMDADAWNLLGYATRKLGRFEEAERHYQKALAIKDDHKGALEYLGMLYVETKRLDQAKAILKRLDSACFFGCEELDELKEAIATGKVDSD